MPGSGVLRTAAAQFIKRTVGNMKAVVITQAGGPEVLQLKDVEEPSFGETEVLIKVSASAVNRADTLQRQGKYPPPAGASLYPGLECSGVIEAVGQRVEKWKVGDEVCALLGGGGYAEKINVPEGQVLPIPKGVSLIHAAALPEVHGGSSGIGTFAIQIAKAKGAKVFCTVGNQGKADACKKLGADVVINYKEQDFVQVVKQETDGKGVNVILDHIGASYFQKNLDALSMDGRLFIIGMMGGAVGQLNLGPVMAKRATVQGAGLRSRPTEQKNAIVAEVLKHVWPEVEAGKVKPIVHGSFPMGEASKAHELMESSAHIGKVVLTN